ncbi:MAG: hypothetical protein OEY23_19015 [Acidimicrobiia bacterium]|nr:hypothetical protein [Acidimicrobiia bacterium]
MRFTVQVPAQPDEVFGPTTFESTIGSVLRYGGKPATVRAATVSDDGSFAVIEVEVEGDPYAS